MIEYWMVLVSCSHELNTAFGHVSHTNHIGTLGMYLAPIRSLYHGTFLLPIRAQHWGLLGPIRVWEYHPSCQSCHEIRVPWYVAMESPNIDTHQQWNWQRTVGSCMQCNGSCPSWGLHCYDLWGLERSSGNLLTIYSRS